MPYFAGFSILLCFVLIFDMYIQHPVHKPAGLFDGIQPNSVCMTDVNAQAHSGVHVFLNLPR